MSIAIHYTSIKPPTGQEREVFGVQVAITDWLRAYFRYANTEKFSFLIGHSAEWNEIQSIATDAGVDAQRLIAFDRRFPEQNLRQFSTIFRPEPDNRYMLWQRRLGGSYAFCGLAHAMSGIEAGEILQDYCLAPSEAADAIVCPSHAVQSAIRSFWNGYGDYLQQRFGTTYRCPVQLPVIPLGVDIEKFVAKVTPNKRVYQRKTLDIEENDIVVLWVGRLSAAIKAHPLSMFQAAERAAQKTGTRVHLVMVGYFVPQENELQFKKLASDICNNATVTFIPANDSRFPDGLWAAGDIFLSLIDNMQESFGLTPIEAMAAGLPRVVSDWNGYRDSVTDSEDGFLIRTMQPPAGNGLALTTQVLSGHEVYGGFLAKAALTVAVDADQAGDRIAQLILDKNLRQTMAAKALTRVRTTYDWRHIIPAYEALWREQAQRKASACLEKNLTASLPQLPDPYTMYEAYPTAALCEKDQLSLVMSLEHVNQLRRHEINVYADDILIAPSELAAVLSWLSTTGTVTIAELFAQFTLLERPRMWRTLAWLQKLGIVRNSSC